MSAEQTYLVRRSDSSVRLYRLYELTWLWRTAELPHHAEYQDPSGAWRPVRELVEPLLEKTPHSAPVPPEEPPDALPRDVGLLPVAPRSLPWGWIVTAVVILTVALTLGPEWQRQFAAWRSGRAEQRQALERERLGRMEDFVRDSHVIPGMTPDQVRRKIGPPRAVEATGDASQERWLYRQQVVVFENGTVVGVEGRP